MAETCAARHFVFSLGGLLVEEFRQPEESLSDAYNTYITNIQTTIGTTEVGSKGYYIEFPCLSYSFRTNYDKNPSFVSGTPTVFRWQSGNYMHSTYSHSIYYAPVAPVDAYYSAAFVVEVDNADYSFPSDFGRFVHEAYAAGSFIKGGDTAEYAFRCLTVWPTQTNSFCTVVFRVRYFVEPYTGYTPNGFTINVGGSTSRIGNIKANYGYENNGEITNVGEVQIVNETNNTFYNPAIDTTSTITNWSYDYSDRSYNLTLSGGTTSTVTYGDENVTIKEGDTVYNIYYMVPQAPEPTPTPPPDPGTCTHTYTSAVTKEPTCLLAGVKTFTCSKCSNVYTEKMAAVGHSWVEHQKVTTVYDENGAVVTQGYTIYQCSVCSEQYKDSEGQGPPGGNTDGPAEGEGFLSWLLGKLGELFGAIGEGIISLLKNTFGKILDGIISIVNMIADKLGTVLDSLFKILDEVPNMFTGFTEFLTQMFAYLPPEIITIFTFGILAIVLVAIFKNFIG